MPGNDEVFLKVKVEDINEIVKSLKPAKVAGPDVIPAKM